MTNLGDKTHSNLFIYNNLQLFSAVYLVLYQRAILDPSGHIAHSVFCRMVNDHIRREPVPLESIF